jgi:peptide-methionine (S)-S-oxide reductase
MIVIYKNSVEFKQKYQVPYIELEYVKEFSKSNYIVEYKEEESIFAVRSSELKFTKLFGSGKLLPKLIDEIDKLGLIFDKVYVPNDMLNQFTSFYNQSKDVKLIRKQNYFEIKHQNIDSCVFAGGCFWCASKPYYEYDGIIRVYSGYSGGNEINPKYDDVKKQLTNHFESIKIVYDKSKISFIELLDIFFFTIDPFDDGGQFIDRGNSYKTAIFYKSDEMKNVITNYIEKLQKNFDKKIMVQVLEEQVFYMAESYHQDFAVKNPELMEKELIESGRKKVSNNENN